MAEPWTPPTLPDIYAAIASYGKTGVLTTYYPAPPQLPKPPALIVFGAGGVISHDLGQQEWLLRVRGHLMIGMVGMTDKEILAGHALVMPLVDQFNAGSADTPGFTLGGRVSHCFVVEIGEDAQLGYAGHSYFGNQVFWNVKLERTAVGG